MRTGKRTIQDGARLNHLIPQAEGRNRTVSRFAKVKDTVSLMKQVITKYSSQTRLLAERLKGKTPYESCANIWKMAFEHLQYEKDDPGKEQVRTPARAWRDGNKGRGIDCDCMTVFIGSLLYNLRIPFVIRLTRYLQPEFEHVYPVALTGNQTIIMDCVVHQFNYEVPYTAKKDITMDLELLNGFDGWEPEEPLEGTDFDDMGIYPMEQALLSAIDDDLEGLEGKAERQARRDARKESKAANGKPTIKDRLRKGVHVVNRLNPGAALVRAGVLVAMKTNMFNIARRLRYAYLTDQQVSQIKNIDTAKIPKLREVRAKAEKIFFGAGGKPENLKKAILTGRGNKDRGVPLSGLGYLDLAAIREGDLSKILGQDIYANEFEEIEIPGTINGLGEAASAAATIAAASSIIGALAAMIKKIGSIFKKGTPEAAQEVIGDNTAEAEQKQLPPDVQQAMRATAGNLPAPPPGSSTEIAEMNPDNFDVQAKSAPIDDEKNDEKKDDKKGGFVQWIKDHPLATAGIIVAAAGVTYLVVKAVKAKNTRTKKSKTGLNGFEGMEGMEGLDGLDGTRRRRRKTTKPPTKKQTPRKRKVSTSTRRNKYPKVKLL